MNEDPNPCFACDPPPVPRVTIDARARALCPDHLAHCTLPDGELLSVLLERARPSDSPLDGSTLAYVYNPVFVLGTAGQPLKGWTDFAGGGMAVWSCPASVDGHGLGGLPSAGDPSGNLETPLPGSRVVSRSCLLGDPVKPFFGSTVSGAEIFLLS